MLDLNQPTVSLLANLKWYSLPLETWHKKLVVAIEATTSSLEDSHSSHLSYTDKKHFKYKEKSVESAFSGDRTHKYSLTVNCLTIKLQKYWSNSF